jgi:hypothetical protein
VQVVDVAGRAEAQQYPAGRRQVIANVTEKFRQCLVVLVGGAAFSEVARPEPPKRRIEDDQVEPSGHIVEDVAHAKVDSRVDVV